MATEKYGNAAQTTVAAGGYTSGSGVLNVASTAAPFPQVGNFRVFVASPTGTVKVILKVTAVNSSTQFAVTAEGTDANALLADLVVHSITAGCMDAIRGDLSRVVSGALPSDGRKGDQLWASDDVVMRIHDGSNFLPFGPLQALTDPTLTTFAWRNQGSASVTARTGSIYLLAPALSNNNIKIRELASYPSTPFTITMAILPQIQGENFNACGLVLVDSGSGKVVQFILTSSGGTYRFQVNNMTSVTSFSSTPVTAGVGNIASLLWMQVTDNGTNFLFKWSTNGLDFQQVGSLGRTAHLATPDKVGMCVEANNGSFAAGMTVLSWKQT